MALKSNPGSWRSRGMAVAGGVLAALLGGASPASAQSLAVGINEVVRGGITADAWGEISTRTSFAGGELHIQVPRGGRVRAARLYSGFTVYYPNAMVPAYPPVVPAGPAGSPRMVVIGNGASAISRRLEGTPRYYSRTYPTPSVTALWGTWVTDVTAAVRGSVGPSSRGGVTSVPVQERGDDAAHEGPGLIQLGGHFLVVEYELDFGPRRNVVVYEGCATTGLVTSTLPMPGAVANRCPAGLPRGEPFAAAAGVMWEFNRNPNPAAPNDPTRDLCSEENSEIVVNGLSLTTRAGGADDWPTVVSGTGCNLNTAGLCTMGTFGGTEPGAGRAAGSPVGLDGDSITGAPPLPRLDDELYDFRTVIADGATSMQFRFHGSGDEMVPVIAFQTLSRGSATDADGDGWSDADEGDCTADADNDGTPDYLDIDSDNDCLPDARETAAGRTDATIPGAADLNCPDSAPVCDRAAGVCLCNSSSDCTRSPAAPVCDAATRTCMACSTDAQCAGIDPAHPACAHTGPLAGRCVGCTANGFCSGATPLCDPATSTCVGCVANTDCTDPTRPSCDAATHSCRACRPGSSTDCAEPGVQACAASGPNTGRCVQCVRDADCRTGSCDTATNRCVGCLDNTQCAGGAPICDPARHVCRPCDPSSATDCRAPTPACEVRGTNAGRCVQCTGSDNRACVGDSLACDVATDHCVLCTPAPNVDVRACVSSPDGPECIVTVGASPQCGCTHDQGCGASDSGRICDVTTHRCRAGCLPGADHNGCPAGQACSSEDPEVPGVCADGCFRDLDCNDPTPRCLRDGDAGAGAGRCVGCVDDTQCVGHGVCSPTDHVCVAPVVTGSGSDGCGCRAPGTSRGATPPALLAGLALAALLRRRRRP